MEGRPLELEPLTEEEREWLLDGKTPLDEPGGAETAASSAPKPRSTTPN
jgi:hypothetical protein